MVLLWGVNKSMGLFLWTWAVSLNKSIWAADFPFVLLSSYPIVTHSAWLSRNIHSSLSLPISRCNKTQQLLLWGDPERHSVGPMRESGWMAANATAHLHFVMAGTRQRGGEGRKKRGIMEGGKAEKWGVGCCAQNCLHRRSMVIFIHRKNNAHWPEWVPGITWAIKKRAHGNATQVFSFS